jgi:hypothetical protein
VKDETERQRLEAEGKGKENRENWGGRKGEIKEQRGGK